MKAFKSTHVAEFRIYARPFRIEQSEQVQAAGLIRRPADTGDFDGLLPQWLESLEVLVAAHLVLPLRQLEFSRKPVARRLIVLSRCVFLCVCRRDRALVSIEEGKIELNTGHRRINIYVAFIAASEQKIGPAVCLLQSGLCFRTRNRLLA